MRQRKVLKTGDRYFGRPLRLVAYQTRTMNLIVAVQIRKGLRWHTVTSEVVRLDEKVEECAQRVWSVAEEAFHSVEGREQEIRDRFA